MIFADAVRSPYAAGDRLAQLLKIRFKGYHFAAAAAFMRPAIEIRDEKRDRVAVVVRHGELLSRHTPSDLRYFKDVLEAVIARVEREYVDLVEAFEGRRPVVWS